jgi:hypothetical protein
MDDLEQLVRRTIAREPGAWPALQAASQPIILHVARRHRSLRAKGLSTLPDDLAEIVVSTLEELSRSDFENLKRYVDYAADTRDANRAGFRTWLYGKVDYVSREHVRKRFGRPPTARSKAARPQPSKRDLQSRAGRLDDAELDRRLLTQVGMTARLTVAQVFEHIGRDFAPDEARALRMYFSDDAGFEDIAAALGLADAREADKLIRRLNARLRYKFLHDDRAPEAQ